MNVSLAASRNIVTPLAILSFAKKDLFYQASVYLFVCLRILTPIKLLIGNGVGTNFGVGVGRRGEALRAENGGWGSWGEDSQPLPPTSLRERCKLTPRGPRRSHDRRRVFLYSEFLSRQIAFLSISVRVAYSLHG